MSADNWAICPKCTYEQNKHREEMIARAEQAYGKITSNEYINLINEALVDYEGENTLREDWELGIWEGEFFVRYSGHCKVCGFNYEYKYEDKNPVK